MADYETYICIADPKPCIIPNNSCSNLRLASFGCLQLHMQWISIRGGTNTRLEPVRKTLPKIRDPIECQGPDIKVS